MSNTQLTSASGYNTKNMIFSDPQEGSIPNSIPPINYKRIIIQTKNTDGSIGDLIIPTASGRPLFSFGVSENTNPETGKTNGYVVPICLWNRDSPSQEEKDWSDTFDAIIQRCKQHLLSNKDNIGKYELEASDLKKLNPLYWKKDKGVVVPGTGPTLYAKLIVSKKQDKIVTMFSDFDGNPVDPLSLIGKYCFANAAIKIESIFIGNKISMQIKLYECEVKLADSGMKSLMKKPSTQTKITNSVSNLTLNNFTENDSDGEGSIKDDDEDVPPPKKVIEKVVAPTPVKIKTKKVVRKTEE